MTPLDTVSGIAPEKTRPQRRGLLRRMGASVTLRLTLLFVLVAVLPMAVAAMLSYQRARTGLIDQALSKVEQEASLTAKDITTFATQFSTDLLTLSDTPPIQAILRARANGSIDPESDDSYDVWIERLTHVFAATARNKQFYQQLSFLDEVGQEMARVDYADGEVAILSGTSRLQDRGRDPYFTEARSLAPGEVYISPMELNRENGQIQRPLTPVLRYSTPVFDEAGAFRGVVVMTVYASNLLERLVAPSGGIYLTDRQGQYLLHPEEGRSFGQELATGHDVDDDFPAAHQALLDSGEQFITLHDQTRGEVLSLKTVHFDPLNPERHWLLIRALPQSEVLQSVNTLSSIVIAMALVIALLVGLGARWIAHSFTQPLIRLTKIARQISQEDLPQLAEGLRHLADGDLTFELSLQERPVPVRATDEIGQLARAFSGMTASLYEAGQAYQSSNAYLGAMIGQVAESAEYVNEASEHVASAAEHAGKASQQIAAAIAQVAQGSVQQAIGVEHAKHSVEEQGHALELIATGAHNQAKTVRHAQNVLNQQMATAIRQVETTATESNRAADEARDAADSGIATIGKSIESMEAIADTTKQVNTRVSEMSERSHEIGAIVQTIDEIAERTNLLALNAAIEAARAGEHGRGFAVVADEVRRLAEQAANSAQEITGLIQAVQVSAEQAVLATASSTSQVDSGLALAGETKDGLRRIQHSVVEVSAQMAQLRHSVVEMGTSSKGLQEVMAQVTAIAEENTAATEQSAISSTQMLEAMTDISAVSEQTSAAAEQVSASAEQVSHQVKEAAGSAENLAMMAQEMHRIVAQFRFERETALACAAELGEPSVPPVAGEAHPPLPAPPLGLSQPVPVNGQRPNENSKNGHTH